MEAKKKEFYEAPSANVIEVRQEGAICISAPRYEGESSVNAWIDGGTTDDDIYM